MGPGFDGGWYYQWWGARKPRMRSSCYLITDGSRAGLSKGLRNRWEGTLRSGRRLRPGSGSGCYCCYSKGWPKQST